MRIGITTSIATAIAIGVLVAASGGQGAACVYPNFPNAGCTGYPAGQSFTSSGGLTISTNDAVYDGYHFTGTVAINATNVTIKNSWIESAGSGITVSVGSSVTVQDTEIQCGGPGTKGLDDDGSTGITLTRVNIHSCEDGMLVGDHLTVQDSYIHDLAVGGGSHNDGIQEYAGSDVTIVHNHILGADTSALNYCNSAGCPSNSGVLVQHNLLGCSSVCSYVLYCPIPATSAFVIEENWFIDDANVAFGLSTDCDDETDLNNRLYPSGDPYSLE